MLCSDVNVNVERLMLTAICAMLYCDRGEKASDTRTSLDHKTISPSAGAASPILPKSMLYGQCTSHAG
jgi:hypothetical protein